MKSIKFRYRLLLLIIIGASSLPAFSQSVTGIWRGYFIADNGYQYKLEFQVKQNVGFAVSGVSYSWQDDIRFYGKATMTGNFINKTQNFRIREIKTVEVKTPDGGTCIMNYNLKYSRSGKEEFLEGTYLGKQEVQDGPNPYEWGDCGGGRVYLRKVTTSDFYIEPSLRPAPVKPSPETKKTTAPPIVKKQSNTAPPAIKKQVSTKPQSPVTKKANAVPAQKKTVTTPPVKVTIDSIDRKPELTKLPAKPAIVPSILKTRENQLAQVLTINSKEVTVKIFDNGEIDDDTISVYLNNKLVLSNKRLTAIPLVLKFTMDDDHKEQELIMVAENLGRIPPNTSVMKVEAGDQSFRVSITSTEQKNAVVRFKYQNTN